jgi:hypothetical protein
VFLEQSTLLRKGGLIGKSPAELKQTRKGSTKVVDEKGRAFDRLRGANSHIEALAKYMDANGGKMGILSDWMGSQAGSSWSNHSQAMKYHVARIRGGNYGDYMWRNQLSYARKQYDSFRKKYGSDTWAKSFAIWNAWQFEALRHIDFERNNQDAGYVEVVRTEGDYILSKVGKASFSEAYKMQRGQLSRGVCLGRWRPLPVAMPHYSVCRTIGCWGFTYMSARRGKIPALFWEMGKMR